MQKKRCRIKEVIQNLLENVRPTMFYRQKGGMGLFPLKFRFILRIIKDYFRPFQHYE
jgi:hypothetical protein